MLPYASVVIPVKDSENTIRSCINSVLGQVYPGFEVIVVDNGSTDGTPEQVSSFPGVRLEFQNKPGSYAARNKGISVAKGDIIAFTDADCVADGLWLRNLVERFVDHRIGLVGGRIEPHVGTGFWASQARLAGVLENTLQEYAEGNWRGQSLFTANLAVGKKAVLDIGGFDESFMSGGDTDLCWRIRSAGWVLDYAENAVVYHKHRLTLSGVTNQYIRYGAGVASLAKKYPEISTKSTVQANRGRAFAKFRRAPIFCTYTYALQLVSYLYYRHITTD
jgi:glycosyltransferase involved in cell wall biosynthesis